MDEHTIIASSSAEGFELEERPVAGAWVWGWCRGDHTRWPCFHERDQALRWMADRLRRVQVFV